MLFAIPAIALAIAASIQLAFLRYDGYSMIRPLIWNALEDLKGVMRRRMREAQSPVRQLTTLWTKFISAPVQISSTIPTGVLVNDSITTASQVPRNSETCAVPVPTFPTAAVSPVTSPFTPSQEALLRGAVYAMIVLFYLFLAGLVIVCLMSAPEATQDEVGVDSLGDQQSGIVRSIPDTVPEPQTELRAGAPAILLVHQGAAAGNGDRVAELENVSSGSSIGLVDGANHVTVSSSVPAPRLSARRWTTVVEAAPTVQVPTVPVVDESVVDQCRVSPLAPVPETTTQKSARLSRPWRRPTLMTRGNDPTPLSPQIANGRAPGTNHGTPNKAKNRETGMLGPNIVVRPTTPTPSAAPTETSAVRRSVLMSSAPVETPGTTFGETLGNGFPSTAGPLMDSARRASEVPTADGAATQLSCPTPQASVGLDSSLEDNSSELPSQSQSTLIQSSNYTIELAASDPGTPDLSEGFVTASSSASDFPSFEAAEPLPLNVVHRAKTIEGSLVDSKSCSLCALDSVSVPWTCNVWTEDDVDVLSTIVEPPTPRIGEMITEDLDVNEEAERCASPRIFSRSTTTGPNVTSRDAAPAVPAIASGLGLQEWPHNLSSQPTTPTPAAGFPSQGNTTTPDYKSDRLFADQLFPSRLRGRPSLDETRMERSPVLQHQVQPEGSTDTTPKVPHARSAPRRTRSASQPTRPPTRPHNVPAPARPANATVRDVPPHIGMPPTQPATTNPFPTSTKSTWSSRWARPPIPDSRGFDTRNGRRTQMRQ